MRFKIYKAKDGWRWKLVGGNNRIVAESGEAYARKRDAARAVYMVAERAFTAPVQQ